jgi:tripartite-type tricarboxylate transporter receptor subunit TctC
MKTIRRTLVVWVAPTLTAFLFMVAPAALQASEKNFIRFVVPNMPGSGVDLTARAISERLGTALGKPVVIENMPGAGGIKGTHEIVRAPKDGNTIGMVSANHVINPSIYKDIPYDAVKDVTPISIVVNTPLVLAVNPKLPARNAKELIALAKSQPGKLNYGSAGNGTVLHLGGELFCSEAGVKITHVPYKGGSQLVTDLIGGHVDMAVITVGMGVQQIKAGTLRAIGLLTPKRSSVLPDVPTMAEAGLPTYIFESWVILIGPARLPQPVVKRLNAAMIETLKSKEVREALAVQGSDIVGSTPEEALQAIERDLIKNAKLVKQSGAKMD